MCACVYVCVRVCVCVRVWCVVMCCLFFTYLSQVELGFLPVGHTHEDIDQMFSSIAEALEKGSYNASLVMDLGDKPDDVVEGENMNEIEAMKQRMRVCDWEQRRVKKSRRLGGKLVIDEITTLEDLHAAMTAARKGVLVERVEDCLDVKAMIDAKISKHWGGIASQRYVRSHA